MGGAFDRNAMQRQSCPPTQADPMSDATAQHSFATVSTSARVLGATLVASIPKHPDGGAAFRTSCMEVGTVLAQP